MKPFFDADNPTDEANHWMSLMLTHAKRSIDEQFGKGFAEKNPELLGAYLKSGASLMNAKIIAEAIDGIQGGLNEVSYSIDRTSSE